MSRVWETKPSPAGIKASIQEPVCSHSNRFHSSLASFPGSQGRPAPSHLLALAPHIRALPKGRWPQTQGWAHLFFRKDHMTSAGSELGLVLSASHGSSCATVTIFGATEETEAQRS